MIEIEGLQKSFGDLVAVAGIDLTVAKGEVLGFLGPNGAGKSTTMKMIAGFLAPSAGHVRILGHDVEEDLIAAQAAIGYLPEGAPAYGDMTPRQFLAFIAEVRGFNGGEAKARAAAAAAKTELEPVLEQPIETLSKGFKRRVGLAQAILHDPPVLIMDEPTDGLDPNQKHSVRAIAPRHGAAKGHHHLDASAGRGRGGLHARGDHRPRRIVIDSTPAKLRERGPLDDVFRSLTTHDAQHAKERRARDQRPKPHKHKDGGGPA